MLPIPPVQILSNPLPSHHFQPPPSNPTALFDVLFLYLNGWLCSISLNIMNGWLCSISWVISLNIMNLHRLSLGNFVPGRPCCVFYATRHQVYWGLTHDANFCCYWFDITHIQTQKNTQTAHSGVNILTHPRKIYINKTSYVLTAAICITIDNSLILKIYFPQCLFLSKLPRL